MSGRYLEAVRRSLGDSPWHLPSDAGFKAIAASGFSDAPRPQAHPTRTKLWGLPHLNAPYAISILTICSRNHSREASTRPGGLGLGQVTGGAIEHHFEAASGIHRRSGAESLQGAADVLEQQHQMEGIRG